MKKDIIIKIILPLFLGGLIYILFRTTSLYMFTWFDFLGIRHIVDFFRQEFLQIKLWDWIIYSLPNGLWLYSFINLFLFIWENQICKINLILIVIPPVFGIGSEIAQYYGFIHGTFDYVDLIICFLATILPFIFNKYLTIDWKKIKLKKFKLSISFLGCLFFLILAYGSNGPGDAVQDMYIKKENDPIKKEKMARKEEFFLTHGREGLTKEQSDSIDNLVDSLARIGEIK